MNCREKDLYLFDYWISITFIWGILAKYQILIYDQTSPKFETTINIKNKDKRVLNFICDSKRLHSIKETDTVLLY